MWVPLMAFAFLYGLSMDYEVFLLARMREEYDGTGSTQTAIVQGLGRVGRLVTCAALILFLSFASMAAIPELDVKIMATALGAGILIDATILRPPGPGPGRPARPLELVAPAVGGAGAAGPAVRPCPGEAEPSERAR